MMVKSYKHILREIVFSINPGGSTSLQGLVYA